jgi:23S rRNA (pseudouridine1915-N3)-methyltransferase
MQIELIVTGKTEPSWLQQGTELFCKRIGFYIPFEMKVIPELRKMKNLPQPAYREKEGELILRHIDGEKDVYLLDEHGQEFSSREFAGFLEKKMVAGCRNLIFVIGGPFGFSDDVFKTAAGSLSLSRLTFSHQLVRLLFVEQLYRACSIIKGEPYHHD